jgi:hypothetical protein
MPFLNDESFVAVVSPTPRPASSCACSRIGSRSSRNSSQAASVHAGGHDDRVFPTQRPCFPHGTVATAARVLFMSFLVLGGLSCRSCSWFGG